MAGRSGRLILTMAGGALVALALLGAATAYAPFLPVDAWWVRWLSFPRLEFAAALGATLALLLLLPGRARPWRLAGVAAAVAGIAAHLVVLAPYSEAAPTRMLGAETCPEEDRLRIVAANLLMTNEDAEGFREAVLAVDPDLIFTMEVDAWWDQRLDELVEDYPHDVGWIAQNFYGVRLLSRLPLVDPQIRRLTNSRDPSIFTGVRLPSGAVVDFYGLHPRPPVVGRSTAQRDAQILAAALAARAGARPAVLAGDLNATPWSGVVRHAMRVGRLLDPRLGRGREPTYGAHRAVMTWPIDHVLATEAFRVLDFAALTDWSADHRPIFADLCLDAAAADLQSAPPLRDGDLLAALSAVQKGQGKAVATGGAPPEKQRPSAEP